MLVFSGGSCSHALVQCGGHKNFFFLCSWDAILHEAEEGGALDTDDLLAAVQARSRLLDICLF